MKRWGHNVTSILPERLLHGYVDVLLNPSKRKAIEHALNRNQEMRETVEAWRSQNANLRFLALVETLPPMSLEMQGTVYRLERRLRRRSSLEVLRVAAVVTLLVAGAAGTAVLAQSQMSESGVLAGFVDDAAQAHRVFTRKLTSDVVDTRGGVAEKPEAAQVNSETGGVRMVAPAAPQTSEITPQVHPNTPDEPVTESEPAREI